MMTNPTACLVEVLARQLHGAVAGKLQQQLAEAG